MSKVEKDDASKGWAARLRIQMVERGVESKDLYGPLELSPQSVSMALGGYKYFDKQRRAIEMFLLGKPVIVDRRHPNRMYFKPLTTR